MSTTQCRAGDAMPTHQLREVHRLHVLVGEGHLGLDLGGEVVPEGGVAVPDHGSPEGTIAVFYYAGMFLEAKLCALWAINKKHSKSRAQVS